MVSIFRTSIDRIDYVIGEKVFKEFDDVQLNGTFCHMFYSNFRIVFIIDEIALSLPIHSITHIVYKTTTIRASSVITIFLRVLHSVTITSKSAEKLYKLIMKILKNYRSNLRCTLSHQDTIEYLKNNPIPHTLNAQNPFTYYMKIADSLLDTRWRISDINRNFHLSSSYPRFVCVPEIINDRMMTNLAQIIPGGRIPVISWIDVTTHVAIYRGGILFSEKITEEVLEYWHCIKKTSKPNTVLPILVEGTVATSKTKLSSISSIALYMSTEIEISSLLESITKQQLPNRLLPSNFSDIQRWERRVRSSINSVKALAKMLLEERKSVVLQSNIRGGTLFTISALTQLLIDSNYRTIRGFCSLIEKEFIFFGFPFSSRETTKIKSSNPNIEYYGSFLLFLDCVWTILSQISYAFQFNKELLIFILDSLHCGIYDSFSFSSEKDRRNEFNRPIWNFILRNMDPFLNSYYFPEESIKLLKLCEGGKFCCTWNSWILQYKIGLSNLTIVSFVFFFFFVFIILVIK